MSDKDYARRTDAEVYFGGVDITQSLRKYLLSLTYTDNEEDETDDLQIVLQDRDNVWLCEWLNTAIQAAASSPPASSLSTHKVVAQNGLNVRSGPGTSYSRLGTLAYGSKVEVASISSGWAKINYGGKTAYVSSSYIVVVGEKSGSGGWAIGDAVIANGRAQYTSYGDGTPGASVTNYSGTISRLNLKSGVPYPIHVGKLGWFAESKVAKASGARLDAVSEAPVKGLYIQAIFIRKNWFSDGKDDVLDSGQHELDSVEASGPPSIITIKGTSLPYRAQIRQTKKNRAWESYTLSGIAREMAALNGMACLYESASDPFYKRVEQVEMSDIGLLSALCHDAGISLKATNNIIVLFDQRAYEARTAVLEIKRGGGGYTKYKLNTGAADTQYASCRVSYVDPATGLLIEATAYADDYNPQSKNNQCLEITAKVSSIAEAKELAVKRLRLRNKYEKSATFTLPGNPALVAGVTVMLTGWGAWSGKYIVKQAKHAISTSGYTTQIRLRPALGGY